MSITKKDVVDVATLARLALTKEQEELYTEQLGRILAYVEKLAEVDTSGVESTTYTVPICDVFREDNMKPSLPQEEALKNAPDVAKSYFRVPKIIG
ncbi:MAG: Asp-tRNA(Asn)/Glu-tRNA(Gln) amidotransferase subunit GatC [Thermodesulfobacteriota bacterium]